MIFSKAREEVVRKITDEETILRENIRPLTIQYAFYDYHRTGKQSPLDAPLWLEHEDIRNALTKAFEVSLSSLPQLDKRCSIIWECPGNDCRYN